MSEFHASDSESEPDGPDKTIVTALACVRESD